MFTAKLLLSACVALMALFLNSPTRAAEERPSNKEVLIYQITVTAAGSKSQGWHGTLYDENGQTLNVEPGKTMTIEIGELVSVAAVEGQIWKPYGMIPATAGMENIIMPDPWTYRLYRTGIGSRCVSWRSELLRGDTVVKPQNSGDEAHTSMGPFIWLNDAQGWVHKSWKVKAPVSRCG